MKKLFIALLFVSIFPLSAPANDTAGYVLAVSCLKNKTALRCK